MPNLKVFPHTAPPIAANGTRVLFSGGAFVLTMIDVRPAAEPYELPDAPAFGAAVEIARFALSPQTLVHLRQQIEQATLVYVAAMAHALPDPGQISDVLNAAAAIESLANTKPPSS